LKKLEFLHLDGVNLRIGGGSFRGDGRSSGAGSRQQIGTSFRKSTQPQTAIALDNWNRVAEVGRLNPRLASKSTESRLSGAGRDPEPEQGLEAEGLSKLRL
jgi:hypothetical protein